MFIIAVEQMFREIIKVLQVTVMRANTGHHYKIVNPVRFFIFVLLVIMIMVFGVYSVIGASDAEAAVVRTYAQVTIQDGDNLWDIIEEYNPDANINVRDAVYDIYEINDIDDCSVNPGDTIFVPIY